MYKLDMIFKERKSSSCGKKLTLNQGIKVFTHFILFKTHRRYPRHKYIFICVSFEERNVQFTQLEICAEKRYASRGLGNFTL